MTSPLANFHLLLFRPLAHRGARFWIAFALHLHQLAVQRRLHVPEEGPMVSHAREPLRRELLRVVNLIWELDVEYGMRRIPRLIAPNSEIYALDPTTTTLRAIKTTSILFLWFRAADVMQFRVRGARYAVAFAILSDPPYHLLDLAWMLCRFQELYITENGH
uniref:Secreted protein n=1 Tax=Mycena chlorophos TaxID=658473 RepID=A0ABQ0L0L0_MYCCL|nr:predicted protein [Mycena chlorophos]